MRHPRVIIVRFVLRKAEDQRHVVRHFGANRADHFDRKRRARAAVAAPAVITPIAFTPQEGVDHIAVRSEEHTSELQSLMRISYAVFCLKKQKHNYTHTAEQ